MNLQHVPLLSEVYLYYYSGSTKASTMTMPETTDAALIDLAKVGHIVGSPSISRLMNRTIALQYVQNFQWQLFPKRLEQIIR